ncbi:MAG: amidohydrolase family protein [Verrucomicrobia bacterium]|nr:amidohydrolase family protein [Verrucomicrobiota bacterium]
MLVRGKHYATGQVVDVHVNADAGVIEVVAPLDASRAADLGGGNEFVAPGFFDIQVNGFAGVDFQNPALTADDLAHATREQLRHGTTQYLATVVTGSHDEIIARLKALARALDQRQELSRTVAGFHLEGPYLSAEEGPRGAHPPEHLRLPSWEEFEKFQEAAAGRIVMVTVAPELPGALRFIEAAAAAGVVVGIGHTAADDRQIADAVAAGAKISTHLGNGSHATLPRHANYIQVQLADDRLMASFITDGHHLPPYAAKNFIRAKGIERSILTTDAISAAGAQPGRYRRGEVELESDATGRVSLPGTPYLAGSSATLEQCVGNAIAWAGLSVADAVRMVTENPTVLLGRRRRVLEQGASANLILFSRIDGRIRVNDAVVRGKVIFMDAKTRIIR